MDELVKLVTQKAGINTDQATKAIGAVIDFLKTKLPAPIANQIQGVLEGSASANPADLVKGLGSMFGKK